MADSKGKAWGAMFGPTADCMELEELTRSLDGRLGEDRKRLAKTHVAECAHCRTELALFSEFDGPTLQAGEQADVAAIVAELRQNEPVVPAPVSWWQQLWTPRILAPVALGFASLLVVVVVSFQPKSSPSQPFVPNANEVVRSQSIEVIGPVGDIAQSPSVLAWRAVPGAASYRVRVAEVDRTELWSGTVGSSEAALPVHVRSRIVPLKTLVWEVTAVDVSGATIARSGLEPFRLQTAQAR